MASESGPNSLRALLRRAWNRPDIFFPIVIIVGSWISSRDFGLPGFLGSRANPHHGFYEAVAQVFPVLLVALFVEVATSLRNFQADVDEARTTSAEAEERAKALDEHIYRHELRRFRAGMAVVWPVVLGESAALIALADKPSKFLASLCVTCLAFAGIALVINFIGRVSPSSRVRRASPPSPSLARLTPKKSLDRDRREVGEAEEGP